jgi:C-terminal processing protease CtpA/Prc
VRIGLPVRPHPDGLLPTDATVFINRGVPVLAAFTGAHADYHTPRDTADKLDYGALRKIADLFGEIAISLANRPEAPDFVPPAAKPGRHGPSGIRVYLGTLPDYARSEVAGLALSGVARGGPADRAGLQAGDVVVEIAGKKIDNIYDYTYALDALKVGERVRVIVLRGDRRLALDITPISRD